MKIDVEALTNNVKPKLNSAEGNLELAASYIVGITIPEDFDYSEKLKNVLQNIRNVKQNVYDIKIWAGKAIDNFQEAEKKNNNVVKSLLGKSFNTNSQGSSNKTGSKVTTNTPETSSITLSSYRKSVNKKLGILEDLNKKSEEDINKTGTVKVASWNSFHKSLEKADWTKHPKKTVASIGNGVISLLKGGGKILEGLWDVGVMAVTAVGSVATGLVDLMNFPQLLGGKKESLTGKMWKNVMGYVAEDHVGNAFSNFYKNNTVGKWLDENAYTPLKSDGVIPNILTNVGEVAGIILISLATFRYWRSSNSRS